jgi:competence protein ComEA
MNRKVNWMVPMSTLLVVAIAATLFLVPGAMADSGNVAESVNINTADTGELTSLPGIGTSKATAIVDYRTEHGPFAAIDELTNVRGIGVSVLDKIRDFIRTQ